MGAMKTRELSAYVILGAVLGAAAGALATRGVLEYARDRASATALVAAAGAVFAMAGAAAARSKRAAVRDGVAGMALAGAAFALFGESAQSINEASPNLVAVALVFFTFIFSAAIGVSHAWSLRERDARLAAGLFAGVAGLLALAAVMGLVSKQAVTASAMLGGALCGGLVWTAVGLARRLFSVDVGQFRV